MKKLIAGFVLAIFLSFALPGSLKLALAQENPPVPAAPQGTFILDTLDWLTPEQEAEINIINKKLDQEGIAQIAVVTLNDCGTDKKRFRHELFNTWGIGHANDNDGLLILVCWYGGDKSRRSVEQEVGYGLESTLLGTLTDRVAKEQFIPAFDTNHPGEGLVAMLREYNSMLRGLPTPSTFARSLSQPLPLILLGAGLVAFGVVAFLLYRIYKMEITHGSRRQEMQETRETKKLVTIISIILIGSIAVLLALTLHFAVAISFSVIALLIIAIVASWSYRGRIKKDDPNQDTSWFSSGRSSGPSGRPGGGGSGGGFGGGSSGGGGSSTGF